MNKLQQQKEINRLRRENRRLLAQVKWWKDACHKRADRVEKVRAAFRELGLKFVSKADFWN